MKKECSDSSVFGEFFGEYMLTPGLEAFLVAFKEVGLNFCEASFVDVVDVELAAKSFFSGVCDACASCLTDVEGARGAKVWKFNVVVVVIMAVNGEVDVVLAKHIEDLRGVDEPACVFDLAVFKGK